MLTFIEHLYVRYYSYDFIFIASIYPYEISGHTFPILKMRETEVPRRLKNSTKLIAQITGRTGL